MKDLIKKLDGAELFLRNRAKAKPAPLTEYDVLILMDISNLICEAIRELEKLQNVCNKKGLVCKITFDEEKLEEIKEDCLESIEYNIKQIQAEAIKEFAESLKEKAVKHNCRYGGCLYDITAVQIADIDNLVKEMVGESE